ncbi:hypothetical protein E4U57_007094 [Claviceps arundinis]|uniref:Uncharacterized protein n=1 Tax=Claviceps arundinis TaxID=1623583 RepID=A0A9P7N162_9HYPO|nr:hypothetical protein E4U57_007094 [Claviceps arundinis]KAG5977481.1 hypothetical protein E4U56_007784 [Claviceps arundinis]
MSYRLTHSRLVGIPIEQTENDSGGAAFAETNRQLEAATFVGMFIETNSSSSNDTENAPCPRAGMNDTMEAFSLAGAAASQMAFDRLRYIMGHRLAHRQAHREMSTAASVRMPELTPAECADLYPLHCTQEQWNQLVTEFSIQDISEIIFGQPGYANARSLDSFSNDAEGVLSPSIGVDTAAKAFSLATAAASQMAFGKIRYILGQRAAHRELSMAAGVGMPKLKLEECADLYPLKCTDEQWAQLVDDFSSEDISEIVLAQIEHDILRRRYNSGATGP